MAVNKVMDSTGNVLVDLTGDTVTADKVLQGYTFHDRSGNAQVGNLATAPTGPASKYEEDNVVRFVDYDGEIVAEYTIAEANALTTLPTPPSHDRLIFECWNHTLEQVQTTTHSLCIGALYNTVDNATYILFYIPLNGNLTVSLYCQITTAGDFTIDWGDGNIDTSSESTGSSTKTHTYSSYGRYTIKVNTTTGEFYLKYSLNSYSMISHYQYITEVNFGTHQAEGMAFYSCSVLRQISVGTTYGGYAYYAFSGSNIVAVFGTPTHQIPGSSMYFPNSIKFLSFVRDISISLSTYFITSSSHPVMKSLILPETVWMQENVLQSLKCEYIYFGKEFSSYSLYIAQFYSLRKFNLPEFTSSANTVNVTIMSCPNLMIKTLVLSDPKINSVRIENAGLLEKVIITSPNFRTFSQPVGGGNLKEVDISIYENPPAMSSLSGGLVTKYKVMPGTLSLYAAATNWSTLYAAGLIEEATA